MGLFAFLMSLRYGTWRRFPFILAPVILLLLSSGLRVRAHSITNPELNNERLRMWQAGAHVIYNHPLLGVGPANINAATLPAQNAHDRSLDGG